MGSVFSQPSGMSLASAISLDWASGFLTLEEIQAISARERRPRDTASMDLEAESGIDARGVEAFDDFATAGIAVNCQSTIETQSSAISFSWRHDEAGEIVGKIAGEKIFAIGDGVSTSVSVKIGFAGKPSLSNGILYHFVRIDEGERTTVLDTSSASLQRVVRIHHDQIEFTAWDLQPGTYRLDVANVGGNEASGAVDVDLTFINTHHSAGAVTKALGNVTADDRLGSDATVLYVGRNGQTDPVPEADGLKVKGDHGVLTIQADGSYEYMPCQDLAGIGMTDNFTYQLRRPDGEIAEATLTIKIGEAPFHGGVAVDTVPVADEVAPPMREGLLHSGADEIHLQKTEDAADPIVQSQHQGVTFVDPLAPLRVQPEEGLTTISSDV